MALGVHRLSFRATEAPISIDERLAGHCPRGVWTLRPELRPTAPATETVEEPIEMLSMSQRPIGRRQRTALRGAAAVAAAALVAGIAGTIPAAAVSAGPGTLGGFEMDGNFVMNTAGNTDWATAGPVTIFDDTIDSGFRGSSKEQDPLGWFCQSHAGGVTPPKDNLLRAYVAPRFVGSDVFLSVAAVKEKGQGDTHVSFELNRAGDVTTPYSNGPCPHIHRQVGDTLISFNFGGTSDPSADVDILTWTGSAWADITSQFTVSAANNGSSLTDPIAPGSPTIPARTFVEATLKFPNSLVTCPGFGFVNLRSRSSHSLSSALQDKFPTTAVDLSSCGSLRLRKVDDLGQPLAGAVFGLFTNAQATGTPQQTCTSAADGNCRFPAVAPGSYWVKEISAPPTHAPDPRIVAVTVGFRQQAEIAVPFVNPLRLGSARIVKTHSLGGAVPGIRFFLTQGGQPARTRAGALAVCVTAADGTCTITGVVPGQYTVVEDAATLPSTMTKAPDVQITVVAGQTAEARFVNPVKPLAIAITKKVNGVDKVTVHAGDPLTYALSITNTGQLPLELTTLTDRIGGVDVTLSAACIALRNTTLAAGATASCTYPATASVDAVNVANVIGRDPFGRTATATAAAEVAIVSPAITIDKLVNGQERATVHRGDPLTYQLTITNTSAGPLVITGLTDVANGSPVTLPPACTGLISPTPLASGGTRSCTYTSTAGGSDVVNVATVVGQDELTPPKVVTDSDEASVKVIDADISIVKTVNGADAVTVHAGDPLTYVLTITNNGPSPLVITSLTDVANGSPVALPAGCTGLVNATPLAVGASRTCTYTTPATAADVNNLATVVGKDPLGKTVSSTDTARVDVINPAITIVKTGSPASIVGDSGPVTFTYLVTNTGDTTLFDIVVTDDPLGEIGRVASLAPGAAVTLTKTATVNAGRARNVGTAVGKDELGKPVSASDDETIEFVQTSIQERPAPTPPAPAPAPPAPAPPAPAPPAPAPPAPAPPAAPLARTGASNSVPLTSVGAGFVAIGLLFLAGGRRRRIPA